MSMQSTKKNKDKWVVKQKKRAYSEPDLYIVKVSKWGFEKDRLFVGSMYGLSHRLSDNIKLMKEAQKYADELNSQ